MSEVSRSPTGVGELALLVGSASHVGQVREHNEDSLIATGVMFAVADGMGGHAAGEVASRIAVERLGQFTHQRENQPAASSDDVISMVGEINALILDAAAEQPENLGMGTTVAGLTLVEAGGARHWLVFNIGDSRVYHFVSNRLSLVTQDHSEVREMIDAGLITAEEATRHPMRNIITRSLGTDPAPNPDLWVFPQHPGERFIICTDGLSNELNDRTMMVLLQQHDDPQEAADALCAAALEAGGRDNISVVVVATEAGPHDEDDADTEPRRHLVSG